LKSFKPIFHGLFLVAAVASNVTGQTILTNVGAPALSVLGIFTIDFISATPDVFPSRQREQLI
jgi:hypothetical protein